MNANFLIHITIFIAFLKEEAMLPYPELTLDELEWSYNIPKPHIGSQQRTYVPRLFPMLEAFSYCKLFNSL